MDNPVQHNNHECHRHCKGCQEESKQWLAERDEVERNTPHFEMRDPKLSEIFDDLMPVFHPSDYGGSLIINPIIIVFRLLWITTVFICPLLLDRYIQFADYMDTINLFYWLSDDHIIMSMQLFAISVTICAIAYLLKPYIS
jgi:hypothetical protein